MIRRFLFIPVMASVLFAGGPRPVRIAVMVDQTGSTQVTRVPQLRAEDFEPLLARLFQTGGEIAVGAIRDHSNRPLLRCRVDQKPERKAEDPREKKMNPFLRQKQMPKYLADKNEEDRREAAWREDSLKHVELFRQQLGKLLDARLAGRTDMAGAVVRADLFLAEPDVDWREPTEHWAIFHSDGLPTVGGPVRPLRSEASVLVVNGTANLGGLVVLKPIALENFGAAVRLIISHSKGE